MNLKHNKLWRAAVLLALGALSSAHAGEASLTWIAPTRNCDGTVLTNLAGYQLQWGQSGALVPSGTLTYSVAGLRPGNWWFSIAATNTAGARSEFVTVE